MPTRNVVLTDHQATLIERLVSSGKYQNASEVLREGLRLVERREAEDRARLQALREAIAVGVADFEAGRFVSLDSEEQIDAFFEQLMEEVTSERDRKQRR